MINSPIFKHCVYHRFGVRRIVSCHRRTGERPNEATSSVHTQVAIIDVSKYKDEEEESEEELEEEL